MQTKCCCGCCSLSTATSVALVIGVIEAIYGIFWNTQLLMLLEKTKSYDLLNFLINVEHIKDHEVVHGLTVASLSLNVFWVIFAIIAARGSIRLSHGLLTPWLLTVYLFTLFDIGTTIYFAVKIEDSVHRTSVLVDPSTGRGTKTLSYLTLIILFSRGGIMWFVNVYLAHVVEKRGKEIDHNHSALALYILTHLSRRFDRQPPHHYPDPPPSYINSYPSFLPSPILERTRDSNTSWSISSEALQGCVTGFENPCYVPSPPPPPYTRKAYSAVDLTAAVVHQQGPACPEASSRGGGVLPR